MKYLVYATRNGAENKSRSEAQRRGCGPITTHWWDVVEGETGDFAVIIHEKAGEEDNLSAADRARFNPSFKRKPTEDKVS